MQAFVAADDRAVRSDDFAGFRCQFPALLAQITPDEANVVARWHEADFLAFGLFCDGKLRATRDVAHFGFRQFAQRKAGAGELLLRQAEEEIGLILRFVGGAEKLVAARVWIPANASVMSGGQALGADLARGDEKLFELHVIITERARNGRAAGKIVVNKRANHAIFKSLLEIHNVKRETEMLRDAARVVDVVERTAAMRRRAFGRGKFREAALVP